jgi:SAM-dependent methyltransferase/8-oxo-dGTP pyrophosphatase MutT (NUDIX family)
VDRDLYFVAVKLLLRDGDKLLITHDIFGAWDIPGGRIKKDEFEAPLDSVIERKIKEELGPDVKYKLGEPKVFFRHERKEQRLGEMVRIFAIGYEAEYQDGEIQLGDHHDKFEWVDLNNFQPERYFTGGWLKGLQDYQKNLGAPVSGLTEEEKITLRAYDQAAAGWSDYFDSGGGWPIELKEFHKFLPTGKILEIGAGGGRDAQDLINLGYDYVGTDVSEPLLDIARIKNPGQKFISMSLYDLSFPEKFDGFWASAVLLHVPKKRIDNALQKIKSTQKKGGIGFISIKDGKGESLESREIVGKKPQRFFAFWSRPEFEETLQKNGFEVLYYGHRIVTKKTLWHMFIVRAV